MSFAEISTFVFLDLETTGLPWQERNQTKIIELGVVAATRSDILRATGLPPGLKKLSFLLNPAREVHPEVTKLTGLSQEAVEGCPLFADQYEALKKFLNPLARPLCIVAHNGNSFDYKILLTEVKDARRRLPRDLLCVDSLVAFRQIDRSVSSPYASVPTDIENEWPDLDISADDWQEIDEICERLSDVSTDPDSPVKSKIQRVRTAVTIKPKEILQDKPKSSVKKNTTERRSYTLSALYTRLLNKEPVNAHRAECDCLMLLECVVAAKHDFLPWADRNCKPLSEIQPLARYKQPYSRRSY